MRGNTGTCHQKYNQPCDFVILFGSHLLEPSRAVRVLFATSFSEPSRRTPKGTFGRQDGAKGYQKEPKVNPKAKVCQNNIKSNPTHNQFTQVFLLF